MKLKDIILAGTLLLSTSITSSGQDKLQFDIYSQGEGVLNPRLNHSSLRMDSGEIDFSFLFGIYSLKFKKINDSTYKEIVKSNSLFKSKEEIFDYSLKDSSYTLDNYYTLKGKPRKEKEALMKKAFNKKYRDLPTLFNDFEKGLLKDSVHFIALGMPYSIKIEKNKKGDLIVYSCNPEDIVKKDPDDFILFIYPFEVCAKNKNGEILPTEFYTKFLNVKNGKNTSIEGELRKE